MAWRTSSRCHRLATHCPDNAGQVVFHLHGTIGEMAMRLGAGSNILGGLHVDPGVVLHRRIWIFELVAGQDADDCFRR